MSGYAEIEEKASRLVKVLSLIFAPALWMGTGMRGGQEAPSLSEEPTKCNSREHKKIKLIYQFNY